MKRSVKLLLLATVLGVLLLGQMELKVAGEFTILPVHNADVRTQIEGIIAEVYVAEGDVVKPGDLLARLSDRDTRAALRQIEAEIAEKRAQLKMLRAGPRREEIALAQQAVETAQTRQTYARQQYTEAKGLYVERRARAEATVDKTSERLKYARSALDMFSALFTKGLVSRKQFEEAEEQVAVREKERAEAQAERQLVVADDLTAVRQAVAVAEKELQEAYSRLRILVAGSRPEEIEATEAAIARLEARRHYLEEQLQLGQVVSPIAGVVTTPRLHEKRGQHVQQGDLIAEVHALTTVTAEIPIAEQEVAEVQVGQRIVLKARAYPHHTFYGTVQAIAPKAAQDDTGRSRRTIVTTRLDNTALPLKPAMTGHAKILCGTRRIGELLTWRLVRTLRVEFWSWW